MEGTTGFRSVEKGQNFKNSCRRISYNSYERAGFFSISHRILLLLTTQPRTETDIT